MSSRRSIVLALLVALAAIAAPAAAHDPVGFAPGSHPYAIAKGYDGALWVVDRAGFVTRFTNEAEFRAGSDVSFPASDPIDVTSVTRDYDKSPDDHYAVFTEAGANRIGIIDQKTGERTSFPAPSPKAGLAGIARGFAKVGDFWFVESDANKLGHMYLDGPPKEKAEYEIPVPNADANDIVRGFPGYWISLSAANAIALFDELDEKWTVFDLPTPGAEPRGLVAASADTFGKPDTVWFTEWGANKLGRLQDGKIDEWPLPTDDARPRGVALAGGEVWVTEENGSKIARFDPRTETFREESLDPGAAPRDIGPERGNRIFWVEQGTPGIASMAFPCADFCKDTEDGSGPWPANGPAPTQLSVAMTLKSRTVSKGSAPRFRFKVNLSGRATYELTRGGAPLKRLTSAVDAGTRSVAFGRFRRPGRYVVRVTVRSGVGGRTQVRSDWMRLLVRS